ncbi:MAG: shikimate kinase [Bacteroidetes bacterium]|nr:MAG: shikimate kinase [Bacteroidota bacterium]
MQLPVLEAFVFKCVCGLFLPTYAKNTPQAFPQSPYQRHQYASAINLHPHMIEATDLALTKTLFLVGMMGSGKSHWGQALSAHFGVPFCDLDALIEASQGTTIANFFATQGETAFRKAEAAALRQLQESPICVVATGGGTPCYHGNMAYMKQQGWVLWLNPPQHELVARLKNEVEKRPVLAATQGHAPQIASKIAQLMDVRKQWYSQAHVCAEAAQPTLPMLLRLLQTLQPVA